MLQSTAIKLSVHAPAAAAELRAWKRATRKAGRPSLARDWRRSRQCRLALGCAPVAHPGLLPQLAQRLCHVDVLSGTHAAFVRDHVAQV